MTDHSAEPLPDEVAGLSDQLRELADGNMLICSGDRKALRKAAAALQQMARERLEWQAAAYAKTMEKADLNERIRELEAVIQWAKPPFYPGDNMTVELAVECSELEVERDQLRQTLSAMKCPREPLNTITIADCTGRSQCRCEEGAVFVKTGPGQG